MGLERACVGLTGGGSVLQECPICLSNITKRRRWVRLHCGHGTCKKCLYQLVETKGVKSDCPLCRAALFQARESEEGEVGVAQNLELAAAAEAGAAEAGAEAAAEGSAVGVGGGPAAAGAEAAADGSAVGAGGGPAAAGATGMARETSAASLPAEATEMVGSERVEPGREEPRAALQS